MDFDIVLIVLNSLNNLDKVLEKGFNIAKELNANCEILYVEEKPLFDIKEVISDTNFDKEEVKRKIENEVAKLTNKEIAILVKIDDTPDRIWDIARDKKDILIVTPYNKDITPKVVNKCEQSVYVLKSMAQIYENIALVAYSLDIDECIEFTKKHFGNIKELLYNFLYTPYIDPIDPVTTMAIEENEILLQTAQDEFNKILKSNSLNGKLFINSFYEEIDLVEYLKDFDFSIICSKEDETLGTLDDILEKFEGDIFIK
jgi:hypothetical protein